MKALEILNAMAILEKYGYMVKNVFTLEDIRLRASDIKVLLSEDQAKEVMEFIDKYFDAEYGICWATIDAAIYEVTKENL